MVKVIPTEIPEVKILEPTVFADDRGYFLETWSACTFAQLGSDYQFVQDNESSSRKGVLRGLHYQLQNTQGKLVRAVRGAVFDVAVDIRRSSPTFGHWVGVNLSDRNRHILWIPPGFAHGFLALCDETTVVYKCTDFYAAQHERTIIWNDTRLAISWPLGAGEIPLVSSKDAAGHSLEKAEVFE